MRPITFTTPANAAADTDSIALSQAKAGAGSLTLNGVLASGGVATLTDYLARPRYGLIVTIKSGGDDSGITFTITGTRPDGAAQSEAVTGVNANTASSALYWGTVTDVVASGAVATVVEVGTAQKSGTAWIPLDYMTPNQGQLIETDVTGTVNYTWQYTADDPFDTSITPVPFSHPTAGMVAASTDQIASTVTLMRAVRIIINSGSGTTRNTIVQQSTA